MTHVRFERVWKSFPRWQAGTRSLRSVLTPSLRRERRSGERRWALEDVSFDVREGRALGIVGHNGAGKSTLLRIASGLSEPSRGTVGVTPDAASVLSLGDTFNYDLTGRENALTAAMVAGMRERDARRALPAILEFAELEEFGDAPTRSYSDGMRLRLAFGVVAQLQPRLLILDEVLAVGDLRFQQKCMDRIGELRSNGTSVLFASHSLEQVAEHCDDAMWLGHGRVQAFGEAEDVVGRYRNAMQEATMLVTPPPEHAGAHRDGAGLVLQDTRFGSQQVVIEDVQIGAGGRGEVDPGSTLEVAFTLRSAEPHDELVVTVAVARADQDHLVCLDLSSQADDVRVGPVGPSQAQRIVLALDELDLAPGTYHVNVGVFPPTWEFSYDYHWSAHELRVRGSRMSDYVYRPRLRRWTVSAAE